MISGTVMLGSPVMERQTMETLGPHIGAVGAGSARLGGMEHAWTVRGMSAKSAGTGTGGLVILGSASQMTPTVNMPYLAMSRNV